MTNYITLSNKNFIASLDSAGQVCQLYYPATSPSNHCGDNNTHHKIGVFSEGVIHWLDDGSWTIRQNYFPGCLISRTICDNQWLGIRLEIQDYVDCEFDLLARHIQVINLSRRRRKIKLFLHQSFKLNNNSQVIDLANYIPAGSFDGLIKQPVISHYQHNVAFVVTGQGCHGNDGFQEYSIGRFGDYHGEHMDGVWCDAADGSLSGNKQERGKTDSIIAFNVPLNAHESTYINYYLTAGSTTRSAIANLHKFMREGIDVRTDRNTSYWAEWLQPALKVIHSQINPKYHSDVVRELVFLTANMGNNGAVYTSPKELADIVTPLVSPSISAVTALALTKLGYDTESGRIFDFFIGALADDKLLYHYYYPNQAPGPNPFNWTTANNYSLPPICLVDAAVLLYSLCQSILGATPTGSLSSLWRKRWTKLGKPLADFLCDRIDSTTKLPQASFSPQTKQAMTTTLDTAAVYKSLSLAAEIAELAQDVDSVIKFRVVTDDIADNCHVLWNKHSDYFYLGLTRQGDATSYDSSIYTTSLLGAKLAGLFSDRLTSIAEKTLRRLHINNNATYLRFPGDNGKSNSALNQIMLLSLLMNMSMSGQLSHLLDTCQSMLVDHSNRQSDYFIGNDIALKTIFILACLKEGQKNSEVISEL